LDKIKTACDTCAACRAWAKPVPESVTSVEIADGFNKEVECDLVFIYKYAVFNIVDRCTRWGEAYVVEVTRDTGGKSTADCIEALDTWISRHGPMGKLICDGESGIARAHMTQEFLRRKGVKFEPRAKDQHARVAERRGALLRDCIHRIDAQLEAEGISYIPFKQRLNEGAFSLNALLSINGSTPFNAVYGRSPKILPDINCPDATHEHDVPMPGLIRHTNRLREIAVQSIIDGTAKARLGRALSTRTLPAGEREGYRVGEEVDIYKIGGNKDVSGWSGPADIVDLTRMSRGVIVVRHNNQVKDVKVGDVRRHLAFLSFAAARSDTVTGACSWSRVRQLIEDMDTGRFHTLGSILSGTSWHTTKDMAQLRQRYFLPLFSFGQNSLRLSNIRTIKCGKGTGVTGKLVGYSEALIVWWLAGETGLNTIEIEAGEADSTLPSLSWQAKVPDRWREVRWILFALTASDEHFEGDADARHTSPPTPADTVGRKRRIKPEKAYQS